MKLSEVRQVLPVLMENSIAPLLWGQSGIGKTETVAQAAKQQGMEMVILNLGTQEVGDLLGLPDFTNNKTEYKVPSWFPTDPNSRGILFLDEINRSRRDVLQAVFSLVLEKRIHTHYLPKGWSIVAAANPNDQDHVVTDISDNAFMNRFCHLSVTNDLEEWATYSASIGTPSVVTSFALEQRSLFADKAFDIPKFFPRNRRLTELGRIVNANLPEELLFEVVVGMLGSEAGTAFMSHRKDYAYSIKGTDVLHNWTKDKEKVKRRVKEVAGDNTRMDVLSVTVSEVFNELTTMDKVPKKVKDNLIDFIMTLPKELSASLTLRLLDHEKLYDLIGNEDVLVDYFKNSFNMDELKKTAEQFESGKKAAA